MEVVMKWLEFIGPGWLDEMVQGCQKAPRMVANVAPGNSESLLTTQRSRFQTRKFKGSE